ncbi:dTDP-glucose 4,6-dehydratase [Clostridia bacterium]|nr:dTDP-glucose 4,6-dehydratase [Clostridia bacterium]
MRNMLVTGGAGFIGSNFIHHILEEYREVRVVNLDCLTYAGNLDNLAGLEKDERYEFVQENILNAPAVEKILREYEINQVIHFAAESHVDRSIDNPSQFIKTNVEGTMSMLNSCMQVWQTGQDEDGYPRYQEGVRYLQVSTDEVYGALGPCGVFTEASPIAPNSPYAASKASADLLVAAYAKTYHFPMNITRCSNNYGPRQHEEKLIPLMIGRALAGLPLPLYGRGEQIRDWIHVRDHCRALDLVLRQGLLGEVYNIGGENECANIKLVERLLCLLGVKKDCIQFVSDRLGHDFRYAIGNGKIKALGHANTVDFDRGLEETIEWYRQNVRH